MIVIHHIEAVSSEQHFICLKIDGKLIKLPLDKVSNKLALANDMERNFFKISPSGHGIHGPLLDEDLSADSMPKAG